METKSLTILINECVMLMRGVGYSEKSILRFKQIWESKLNHFMSVKGLCKFPMREKLPSVYSTEEITIIGSTINRKGLSGKCFYTAFLLGAILGLRRSDIINLTFSNIDWEHNTVSLFQEKTKKRVELPLTKEVGSALIDYLKNERKNDCADKHVFLTLKPPLSKDVGGYTLCRDSNCNMGF